MNIQQALDALGDDQETIRRTLAEKGIKGYTVDPRHCPLAMYLKQCGFLYVSVSVGITYEKWWWFLPGHIPMPEYLRDFIRGFDKGLYPELLMEE